MHRIGVFVGSAPMDFQSQTGSEGGKHTMGIDRRWGEPSEAPIVFRIGGVECLIMRRHGRQGEIAPHEINYRANLWQMHVAAVSAVIGTHTVGGIDPSLTVGSLVIPDQLIDYTWGRKGTYDDRRRHIEFSEPYDPGLRQRLMELEMDPSLQVGGIYGCTQGPRLETPAEIRRMANDGCTLVGMTGMPEAALAAELGLPFTSVCLVVNPAAGVGEGSIDMQALQAISHQGAEDFVSLIRRFCLEF